MIFGQWIFFDFIFDWFEWHFWRSVFDVDALFNNCYEKKIIKIIKKFNPNKTFKSNNIINWFLKICENGLINLLTLFFQMCVNRKYYFKIYQKNNTMILHKFDKNNYDVVKTWDLIILLNMVNKIFESIINKKLLYLAKHHDWLLAAQMKTQLNKSMKIILKLFIEQMHMMSESGRLSLHALGGKPSRCLRDQIIIADCYASSCN